MEVESESGRAVVGMEPEEPGPQAVKLTTIDLVGGILCNICRLTYKNKKDYDSHYFQHNLGTDKIVYTCGVCFKNIAGYPSFRGHCYTAHVIKERFKCDYCNKLFSKSGALKDHIASLHKFECSCCKREFPTKKELQLHKIIHMNDKPPFNCQTCKEEVDCIDACEQHIDQHSVTLYSCPICSEKIDSKPAGITHLSIHFGNVLNSNDSDTDSEHNDKPEDSSIDLLGGILCSVCGEIFKNRAEIDLHFSQEHPETSVVYTCNICGKAFEKYIQFGHHCYEHISKNRYKCDSCDKSFSRLARLVTHTEAFHARGDGGSKPLICQHCPQQFASEFRFREHQRLEHDICVIMCSQPGCGEIFETPKELVLHQKQHSLSSDLWCRLCGLQFTSRSTAERHLDVHRKKTFSCPVCSRKYGEKYLLMKHVPQHFETVIHMCKVCGKLYNAKNRLIEHSKTHANVKNYNCSYCAKGFTSIYKLKQHQNMHMNARPYQCTVCTKDFNHYSNWRKHLLKTHKIDPKTIKKPQFKEKENVSQQNSVPNLIDETLSINIDMRELDDGLMGEGGMKENYLFLEPVTEAVDLDSINPSIAPGTVEFAVLPPAAFVADLSPLPAPAPAMPREYGPDFMSAAGLLDDHLLPHIDPLLPHLGLEPRKWEPRVVTRYQPPYAADSRRAVFNTDIF
ncbi:zinc finger protein 530-like [Leguminivora glycinivorella]|uniref:zinc finger protein 530-like n=1 Tax=Leguminivora glycinivorella TaxID=1035111 RepID=UPI00200CE3F9|nr:zinc finger protein 530-like [Leguminivora glycinivorella]